MQKRSWILLAGAFGAAILALLLRLYQLARVYDPVSMLPRSGALASIALALLAVAYIVFLCVVLRRGGFSDIAERANKLAVGKTILTPLLCAALGIAVIVSGLLMLRGIFLFPFPNLRRILSLFVIAAGVGMFSMGFLAKNPEKSIAAPMFILPVACFCIYLIIFYKEVQNDPVTWSHAVQILAIAANALSFFYLAGFVFNRPRPTQSVLFCLIAFSFSVTVLADDMNRFEKLLYAAMALYNLLFAVTILENCDTDERRNQT